MHGGSHKTEDINSMKILFFFWNLNIFKALLSMFGYLWKHLYYLKAIKFRIYCVLYLVFCLQKSQTPKSIKCYIYFVNRLPYLLEYKSHSCISRTPTLELKIGTKLF